MLARADDEHGASEPRRKLLDDTCALDVIQRGRGGEVKAQLHARVGSVHTLPSRA